MHFVPFFSKVVEINTYNITLKIKCATYVNLWLVFNFLCHVYEYIFNFNIDAIFVLLLKTSKDFFKLWSQKDSIRCFLLTKTFIIVPFTYKFSNWVLNMVRVRIKLHFFLYKKPFVLLLIYWILFPFPPVI